MSNYAGDKFVNYVSAAYGECRGSERGRHSRRESGGGGELFRSDIRLDCAGYHVTIVELELDFKSKLQSETA